jgi:hypothetical protein
MASEHPLFWLRPYLKKPFVTQAGVLEIVGPPLTAMTLQNYANRKILEPVTDPHRKTRRLYDGWALLSLYCGLPLIEQGLGPTHSIVRVVTAYTVLVLDLFNISNPDGTVTPARVPLDDVESYCALFGGADPRGVSIHHASEIGFEARKFPSSIILPIGRLSVELAERTRKYVEDKQANHPREAEQRISP